MDKKRKRTSLAAGRPPNAAKPPPSVNHKANRKTINTHHQLNKALSQAKASKDTEKIAAIQKQIADLGGLRRYQLASIQGQSLERGGDSSSILLDFLQPLKPDLAALGQTSNGRARLLEIGALSMKNACARSGLFDLTRIDLHSQVPGIVEQDFMERPLPQRKNDGADKFEVVSLSLVLNFVPDAKIRGEMLRRTCTFLDRRRWRRPDEGPEDELAGDGESDEEVVEKKKKEKKEERVARNQLLDSWFPMLFLVLPAPCVSNSRYCSEERLTLIMASLGYVLLRVKMTERMYYSLWQLRDPAIMKEQKFPKREINRGGGRNNFAIVLK